MNAEEAAHRIRPIMERAVVREVAPGEEVSLLFSGGLDSSLLAWLVQPRCSLELVTVGTPESEDVAAARTGAALLGLPWRAVPITPAHVAEVVKDHRAILKDAQEPHRSVAVTLALALRAASHPKVLCGQGADELFLGYAHFEGLSAPEATERRRTDLDRLIRVEWPRAEHLAAEYERQLFAPYLDSELVAFLDGTPVDPHLPAGERKPVLRALAREVGLPAELADRPKKAMQYGSGVAKIVKKGAPTPKLKPKAR